MSARRVHHFGRNLCSNGLAQAFAHNLKRDYVRVNPT